MILETLNINGAMMFHSNFPFIGDEACLFSAISVVLYETKDIAQEVCEKIVVHVASHWEDYSIMSHDYNGNNYSISIAYFTNILQFHTHGGLCVKRLRFSSIQDLSHTHCDDYLPHKDGSTTRISESVDSGNIQF